MTTAPAMKMTTDIPSVITTPGSVATRLGTLNFFDGFPDDATVEKVMDNLDFSRGVQAFLSGMPGTSLVGMRTGFQKLGAINGSILLYENLLDSRSLFLTGNTDSVYFSTWLDLKDGPLVLEAPPKVLAFLDDFWFENIKKTLRIYPLAQAKNPPETKFINASGVELNTVHANDFSYFEELNQIVQEEPSEALDPERLGLFASIGIEKGKPFAPDARMKKILTDA